MKYVDAFINISMFFPNIFSMRGFEVGFKLLQICIKTYWGKIVNRGRWSVQLVLKRS